MFPALEAIGVKGEAVDGDPLLRAALLAIARERQADVIILPLPAAPRARG